MHYHRTTVDKTGKNLDEEPQKTINYFSCFIVFRNRFREGPASCQA